MHSLSRFFLYAAIGGIGSIGHFSVLIAMVEIGNSSPLLASSLGFITGGVINYFLNHKITFKSESRHITSMPKFFSVALLGFCSNGLIMYVGTEANNLHYFLTQLIAALITLLITYTCNRLWTFKL